MSWELSGPFNAGSSGPLPALTPTEFRESLRDRFNGDLRECIGAAVDEVWPVGIYEGEPVHRAEVPADLEPSYREHQREAVIDVLAELYVADKDVVTLSAPTGAGKSLIIYAVVEVLALLGHHSFATTPLNALIDQMETDEFLSEVITIKGKNNYDCVHPHDAGTSVDKAICQRTDQFDCEFKDRHHERGGCPYYGRKHAALMHPEVVTNLSYLMANSMIPDMVDSKFDMRDGLLVDECQNIEDFGLQFVGFNVSKFSVPVIWDRIPRPPRGEDVEKLAEWLRADVLHEVDAKLQEYEAIPELTEEQNDNQEKLQQFRQRVNNFLADYGEHHWVAEKGETGDEWSVEFQPIFIGRFLDRYLWSQGRKVVLSSATIPRGGFLEEVGLSNKDVAEVEVPSTFPPGRRPVYTDCTVGKMTYYERDKTIPKLANELARIARHHEGQKGFVHCHAYSIMERVYEALPSDVRERTRMQDPDRREESLAEWTDAPVEETGYGDEEGGQVFLSVAMDEGISLDDDLARWQVVAKAAYPNMNDKRVDYRMDDDTMGGPDWTWYSSKAAINLQQAAGRGMRSKDDWCHTYILDKSAADLIDRNGYLFEDWFLDAVDVAPTDDIPGRA